MPSGRGGCSSARAWIFDNESRLNLPWPPLWWGSVGQGPGAQAAENYVFDSYNRLIGKR